MAVEKKFFPSKIYSPSIESGKKWFVYWYEDKFRAKKYIQQYTSDDYPTRMKRAEQLKNEIDSNFYKYCSERTALYHELEERKNLLRTKSYSSYKAKFNTFFTFVGSYKVKTNDVVAFFRWLQNNRHATTYNSYLTTLRDYFSFIGKGVF